MKRAIIPVLALIGISGCGGDGTTTPKGTAADQPAPTVQTSGTKTPSGATNELPAIPVDARYSIECSHFSGPDHVQQARLMKDRMIANTGRKDFYVVHNEGYSVLYLGYYKAIDRLADAGEAKRSTDDLDWLSAIKTPAGGRMFTRPLKVPIATPNPDAPSEWDLTTVDADKPTDDPGRRYWTIVVAGYTNDVRDEQGRPADRKKLAVDSVREARAQGVEAYFYHGESMSQVCVGAWPRRAIREQEMDRADSGSEARAMRGESLIVSPAPLPDKTAAQWEDAANAKVVQPKVVVQDPSLAKALQDWARYPYSVNSVVQTVTVTDPVTKKQTARDQPPFLAEIPKVQKSLITNRPAFDEPQPTMINPMGPGTGATGGLRGLGR